MNPVSRLGAMLRAAGYSEEGLAAAAGVPAARFLWGSPAVAQGQRLPRGTPLGDLSAWLLLGEALPEERLIELLSSAGVTLLRSQALAAEAPGGLRCPVQITPYRGLLVAHDRSAPTGDPDQDHVLGLSPPTRALADLTLPRRTGRVLDLGTGSGVLALLAAGRSEEVVGTDPNLRALRLAALNAALNDVGNATWRVGEFYEPVADDRFDLITANPPFVVSPETGVRYRDGGHGRDEVAQTVVAGAAAHLSEGGVAQIMANWVRGRGEHWLDPILPWIEGNGCDVLVLHHRTVDAVDYAAAWNGPLRAAGQAAYDRAVGSWCAHYRAEGIDGIASGLIVLRRRAGTGHWRVGAEMATSPGSRAGAQVGRMIEAHDRLQTAGGGSVLLDQPLRPSPGVEVVARHPLGRQADGEVVLAIPDGAGLRCTVPAHVLPVLAALDGLRMMRDLLAGTTEDVAGPALQAVRALLQTGMLEPTHADVAAQRPAMSLADRARLQKETA